MMIELLQSDDLCAEEEEVCKCIQIVKNRIIKAQSNREGQPWFTGTRTAAGKRSLYYFTMLARAAHLTEPLVFKLFFIILDK